jgi:hypothetical protein
VGWRSTVAAAIDARADNHLHDRDDLVEVEAIAVLG